MTELVNNTRAEPLWMRISDRTRQFVRRVAAARPFGIAETESIMQFARLGTLTCLCASRHAVKTDADRRQVCRECGCLAPACEGELLDRAASAAEIQVIVGSLRLAGVRARGVDIPETVQSIQELHAYLDGYRGKRGRKPPRRPNAPVALSRAETR